ncbi:MAG TPA: aminotransferase class V-fold PLP-dependent enzyme [Allocoleopsis sp.]
MSISLEQHRLLFPGLQNKIYFNYGGQGPLPQSALDAIFQSYQHIQTVGPFSQKIAVWIAEEFAKTKEAIATELNVNSETITLTENVTVGCNIGLWGVNWQSNDHILISDCEHPGIIATINEIQRRFNIQVSVCNLMDTLNEGDPITAITEKLQDKTKMIVLSHIFWNTGQLLPLKQISESCKNIIPDVKILVDAAQSIGMLPLKLDELGIDFYAFTGHKWWCGAEGLGGLYINPEILADFPPTFIGWRGLISHTIDLKNDATKHEVATSNYPILAGLRNAISLHNQYGSNSARYQQILTLSKYLWSSLSNLPEIECLRKSPPETGLVSFIVKKHSSKDVVKFLENNQIYLRMINEPDCIRACTHYFTTFDEIDQLVSKIKELLVIKSK